MRGIGGMATYSGSLDMTATLQEGTPFTASFGDITTNIPWRRPTTTKVNDFQTEWFDSNDISSFNIWLCGSYRESIERNVDWPIWDVDYVINGDLNSTLVDLLQSALTIGFNYKLLVDAIHWNIPPLDYTTYNGTKTTVTMTRQHKRFRKDMNGDFFEVNRNETTQINGLELYQYDQEFPTAKQLTRIDIWYHNGPLIVNSAI